MRNFFVGLWLVLASNAVQAWMPSHYSADAFSGRVVDAETKRPIQGVSVVAKWEVTGGMEGHSVGIFHVEEAVTNDSGEYQIAGWGPLPATASMSTSDPAIFFFKAGYQVRRVSNLGPFTSEQRRSMEVRNSFWNKKTIELRRLDIPPREYVMQLGLGGATTFLLGGNSCAWKETPKFMKALDEEARRIRATGTAGLGDLTIENFLRRSQCAPFEEFQKRFQGEK